MVFEPAQFVSVQYPTVSELASEITQPILKVISPRGITGTPYPGLNIDITEALKTFDRLQLEGGDLGAFYWQRISELVKEAEGFRARA